ncbi:MAG: helix-turn-helix domain-containing protein [Mariprofundaceae bacterium]
MLRESSSASCPLEGLLDILQDRWAFLILRDAFYGVRRFDGFRQHLGISRKTLSARLRHMVEEKLFSRVPYQQHPPRYEYLLTGKGRDLFPVLLTMIGWGNRWLAAPDMQTLDIHHLHCGSNTKTALVCSHCGEPLSQAHVRPLPGPGADPQAVASLKAVIRKSSRRKRIRHG